MPFRSLPCKMVMLALLTVVTRVGRADVSQPVELPKSEAFAINPDTGVLAAVETELDEVRFYPKISEANSTAGAVALPMAKGPVGITFKQFGKQALFIVTCAEASKAMIVDAVTLKVLKEIPLDDAPGQVFASSNPDDRYVYFSRRSRTSSPNTGAGVIDLQAMKSVGFAGNGGLGGEITDGAVSADGGFLYGRDTMVSPSGFCANRLTPQAEGKPPKTLMVHYDHRGANTYAPDPFGERVGCGSEIFSPDLSRSLGKVPGRILCFMPNHPIILTQDGTALDAVSANTLKTLANLLILPASDAQVVVDPKNDTVLVCGQEQVQVVKFSDFGAPSEPWLSAEIVGPRQLTVGMPAVLKIQRRDASVKVALKDPPKGLRLDGDILTLTPGADQVGSMDVQLQLSSGQLERMQNVGLRIAAPSIDLPFLPNLLRVSQDGSVAVIATGWRETPGIQQPHDDTHVALVDLRHRSVLVEKGILNPLSEVAVDDRYVYAALRDSATLLVLDRKDLSEVKRLFTSGHISTLLCRGGKLVIQTDNGATTLLKCADLSAIDSPALMAPQALPQPSFGRGPPPAQLADLGDLVMVNGLLFDGNLDKVVSLLNVSGIEQIDASDPNRRFRGAMNPPPPPQVTRWGVYVDHFSRGLRRADGQALGQFQCNASIILNDRPAIVSLKMVQKMYGPHLLSSRAELTFRELVSGSAIFTDVLMDDTNAPGQRQNPYSTNEAGPPLTLAGRNLLTLVADRLFVTPLPTLDPAQFPMPLTFAYDQGVIVQRDKAVSMAFTTTGGTGGVEYALQDAIPGVEIDKDKGIVTIQPSAFTELALDLLAGKKQLRGMPGNLRGRVGDLAAYKRTAGARFKSLTGRDPQGFPVVVSITVKAQDKSEVANSATRALLLEVADDLVQNRVKELAAAAEPPIAVRNATTLPTDGDVNARLEQLDRRVQSLEAKVDLLTKMLRDDRK